MVPNRQVIAATENRSVIQIDQYFLINVKKNRTQSFNYQNSIAQVEWFGEEKMHMPGDASTVIQTNNQQNAEISMKDKYITHE